MYCDLVTVRNLRQPETNKGSRETVTPKLHSDTLTPESRPARCAHPRGKFNSYMCVKPTYIKGHVQLTASLKRDRGDKGTSKQRANPALGASPELTTSGPCGKLSAFPSAIEITERLEAAQDQGQPPLGRLVAYWRALSRAPEARARSPSSALKARGRSAVTDRPLLNNPGPSDPAMNTKEELSDDSLQ